MQRLSKRAFQLLLLVAVFMLGFEAHNHEAGAYGRIEALMRRVSDDAVHKFIARQYSSDTSDVPIDKLIDTALLPIDITGIRLSDHFHVPKIGGAIVAINNELLVIDRLGNLYACAESRDARKLAFPPLPNNIEAYLRAGKTIDSKSFRTYDINYLRDRKLLIVSHESYDATLNGTRLAISSIEIEEAGLKPRGPWKTIFNTDIEPGAPNEASGGRLAVDNTHDKIYLSVGVYDINDATLAQDPRSSFGKIFEINAVSGQGRVVSIGHRNPQGLTTSRSNELWSTEHGPAGGDELNLISPGTNYGWPNVTLGTNYNAYNWNGLEAPGRHEGYQPPIFAWVPSVAVSNLIQVSGFDKRWDGDLIVSSLKAQSLFRLRLEQGRVVYSEPIWIGQRIRDIAELEDGTIALWTDDTQVLFLSVDKQHLTSNKRLPEALDEKLVLSGMYCHHLGSTKIGDAAPSLSNLLSRKIGSDTYRYTAALRNKGGMWTEETLRQFLSSPSEFANGTSMPSPNLSSNEIDRLVSTLKNLDEELSSSAALKIQR